MVGTVTSQGGALGERGRLGRWGRGGRPFGGFVPLGWRWALDFSSVIGSCAPKFFEKRLGSKWNFFTPARESAGDSRTSRSISLTETRLREGAGGILAKYPRRRGQDPRRESPLRQTRRAGQMTLGLSVRGSWCASSSGLQLSGLSIPFPVFL